MNDFPGVPTATQIVVPLQRVSQLCQEFDQQWNAATASDFETLLARVPDELRLTLLRNLLHIELSHRRAEGEQPAEDEYLLRLPDYQQVVKEEFLAFTNISLTQAIDTHSVDDPQKSTPTGPHFLPALPPGFRLGDYVLEKELGRGGMGVVFAALHVKHGTRVALKTLPTTDGLQLHRFKKELTEQQCIDLVIDVVGADNASVRRHAAAMAEETGRNPFLLTELASCYDPSSESERPMHLEEVVQRKLDLLPADARILLDVVSISGQALVVDEATVTAGHQSVPLSTINRMRSERLLRIVGDNESMTIDTYHDRVRETVLRDMASETRRGLHVTLAETRSRRVCRWARVIGFAFVTLRPHCYRAAGRVAAAGGNRKKAIKCFDRAIASAEKIGTRYELARALIDKSVLDHRDARADRERALELLNELNCVLPLAERQFLEFSDLSTSQTHSDN